MKKSTKKVVIKGKNKKNPPPWPCKPAWGG